MDSSGMERRRGHRIDATLDIKLHLDLSSDASGPAELETLNVSSSGVYFKSDTYIEPMTKLALSFDVPVSQDPKGDRGAVNCEGIVARILPEIPADEVDFYEVAVFFTTIDAESLGHLENYISARITP